jgi:hypothetical protein
MSTRDKTERIRCRIPGLDIPQYYLCGIIEKTLQKANKYAEAEAFLKEAQEATSTSEIVKIAEKYVEII